MLCFMWITSLPRICKVLNTKIVQVANVLASSLRQEYLLLYKDT